MDINRIRSNIENHYKQKKREQYREATRNYHLNKYYQSQKWKKLRSYYRLLHPCCEVCEKQGFVTPATEVHHLAIFDRGLNDNAKWSLLLNPENLCACCNHHHQLFHKYMRLNNTDSATIDEIIAYEQSLNKEY